MQNKLVDLLNQLNPTFTSLETVLGIKKGTLHTYIRQSQRRNMPPDIQLKIKNYLITASNFVLSELSESDIPTQNNNLKIGYKKSSRPELVKDEKKYYPSGDGYIHFKIGSDYLTTDQTEVEINGSIYEFNPATKIAGLMYERKQYINNIVLDLPPL